MRNYNASLFHADIISYHFLLQTVFCVLAGSGKVVSYHPQHASIIVSALLCVCCT